MAWPALQTKKARPLGRALRRSASAPSAALAVERPALLRHLAKDARRLEALAVLLGQRVRVVDELLHAVVVDVCERAAGERGEAHRHDDADITVADVADDALVDAAGRLEALGEEVALPHGLGAGLLGVLGDELAQVRLELTPDALVLAVVLVEAAGLAGRAVVLRGRVGAPAVVRLDELGDDALGGRGLPLFAGSFRVLLGLLGDLVHGAEADLVADAERGHRHPGELGGVLDERRLDALEEQLVALRDERAEDAARVEAGAVVDDDGGLLDLEDVVPGLRQGLLGRLLPHDDLDHLHPLDGREEVHPDEVLGAHARLGELGDRQARRVGREDAALRDDRLCRLGDGGLDAAVLEDGLDDDVAALEVLVVGARLDAAEDPVDLLLRRPALFELASQALLHLGLAALGGVEIAVEEHHVDADLRRDMGDALPHQPSADDPDLLHVGRVVLLRPAGALLALLQAEEERAQHGARGRVLEQRDEVAGLDLGRAVHREAEPLVDGREDRLLARHVPVRVHVGHRDRAHHGLRELGAIRAAARDLEALLVPRLQAGGEARDRLSQFTSYRDASQIVVGKRWMANVG